MLRYSDIVIQKALVCHPQYIIYVSYIVCNILFCNFPAYAQSIDKSNNSITFNLTKGDTDGLPVQMVHRMFRSNLACPSAKLDLWFNDGSLGSMLFVPGPSNTKNQIGNVSSFGNASVFTIGPTECRFKVTIEGVETNKPPPATSEQQEQHD